MAGTDEAHPTRGAAPPSARLAARAARRRALGADHQQPGAARHVARAPPRFGDLGFTADYKYARYTEDQVASSRV